METLENTNTVGISKLKNDIKELSKRQRWLKNQMKTVNLVGDREMETWRATTEHNHNRMKLVLMYAAYQILRGREVVKPKTLDNYPGRWYFYSNRSIQTYVDKYTDTKSKLA